MDYEQVLLIDPDESTYRLIEETLNSHFQVLHVSQGKRAIEIARRGNTSIAILARCLPDLDGLEVLRLLKQEIPSLPIIFIAVSPSREFIISAFRAGVRDFFIKPLDADELEVSVRRILTVRRGIRNSTNRNDRKASIKPKADGAGKKIKWNARLNKILHNLSTNFNGKENTEKSKALNYARNESCSTESVKLGANFLGHFHIVLKGKVIENWPAKKGRALFAYILFKHNKRITKDILMDTFWPNSSWDSARNCLNVVLHGIRHMLHHLEPELELIQFSNDCYFLNPKVDLSCDIEDFLNHWRLAQSLEREKGFGAALGEYEHAAALYKGDFMEEDIYEEWTTLERENLKEIYLVILGRLSKYYSSDGKPTTAVHLCKTILEKDNCREDIHRLMMRSYFRLGQRDKALKQFHTCTEILKTELEVDPTQRTWELYEKIRQGLLPKN